MATKKQAPAKSRAPAKTAAAAPKARKTPAAPAKPAVKTAAWVVSAAGAKKPAKAAAPAQAASPASVPSAATAALAPMVPSAPAAKPLTALEERFALEYLADLNATQAYLRANPDVKTTTAGAEGFKFLKKPEIAARIKKLKDERANRTEITSDRALKEVWGILTADARELVEWRKDCCRNCWGVGFGFHRTAGEIVKARAAHAKKLASGDVTGDFDEQGGPGFHARKEPNPECPECFGEGFGRMVINDTRTLSPQAASIYAGMKQTKEGLEVKLHNKLDAAEKLFKHLGLYEKDNEQKINPLAELLKGLGGKSAFGVVKDVPRE